MIENIEIINYRNFEKLRIEKFGRVNLIVGKNNTGKTNLLEAISILAQEGNFAWLVDLLALKGEVEIGTNNIDSPTKDVRVLKALINKFSQDSFVAEANIKGMLKFNTLQTVEFAFHNFIKDSFIIESRFDGSIINSFECSYGEDQFFNKYISAKDSNNIKNIHFCNFSEYDYDLEDKWNNLFAYDYENKVVENLKLLIPTIRKIYFKEYFKHEKTAMILTEGSSNANPLLSYGEGSKLFFKILVNLYNCKDGYLFVDEIDTGLHYTVLKDLWNIVFKVAEELNVQVFATTHSKDCIEAFTQSLKEHQETMADAQLIRLTTKSGELKAVNYNFPELESAVNYDIETR